MSDDAKVKPYPHSTQKKLKSKTSCNILMVIIDFSSLRITFIELLGNFYVGDKISNLQLSHRNFNFTLE